VGVEVNAVPVASGLQRVSEVPIYATDAVVRRSPSLQQTKDAATPKVSLHSAEIAKLGLQVGEMAVVSQGQGSAKLLVQADDCLPQGVARVPAGHQATAALGAMFGTITVERA
jgi:NADH-quinone oxidoreductase subunit G